MKPRPALVFAIHPVQHQHVQVHVEIERRAKALNECDDAAPGAGFAREARTVDQVGFDGTDHNRPLLRPRWECSVRPLYRQRYPLHPGSPQIAHSCSLFETNVRVLFCFLADLAIQSNNPNLAFL